MRKQYKNKKRSCAMCKPYKHGWSCRWKAKELNIREQQTKEIEDYKNESEIIE